MTTKNNSNIDLSNNDDEFFVDKCFNNRIERLMVNDMESKETYKNYEDQKLYTFEEFIIAPSKSENLEKQLCDENPSEYINRTIRDLDEFYNIELNNNKNYEIPDDPLVNNNNNYSTGLLFDD